MKSLGPKLPQGCKTWWDRIDGRRWWVCEHSGFYTYGKTEQIARSRMLKELRGFGK